MSTLIIIGQLLLSLSILVILHECGHFFPAKWFKTRVEKFYLFFDPYFSIFKKKVGDTEYGIGWLPLGGYVKISGMVDESMDINQLKQEPQPWEFRSKPAWQRLIIMLGGITVNFILGFFIFAMLIWRLGITYLPTSELKYGIVTDSISQLMGFRDGDVILGIQGEKLERFDRGKIIKSLVLENKNTINILRDGQETNLTIPQEYIALLTKQENKDLTLWRERIPAIIDSTLENSPAQMAGLNKGDRIFSINGEDVNGTHDIIKILKFKPNVECKLGIIQGTDSIYKIIKTDEKGFLGIVWKKLNYSTEKYGFFESIPLGIEKGMDLLISQLKAFGQMFGGKIKAKDSLGGFASIAGMFDPSWNWISFWTTTAIISIILAFMNLLPIPGLDGGYVIFLLWEVVSGKKVSDKFMEKAVTVGFVLLIALMLYANGLDIMRWLNK
ncbi:MAG: RIP metalloprotease RseP [Saprospiraceae bacterium]|nr:RIP metalloprotease RseP [Saprospiraceae bacterium]